MSDLEERLAALKVEGGKSDDRKRPFEDHSDAFLQAEAILIAERDQAGETFEVGKSLEGAEPINPLELSLDYGSDRDSSKYEPDGDIDEAFQWPNQELRDGFCNLVRNNDLPPVCFTHVTPTNEREFIANACAVYLATVPFASVMLVCEHKRFGEYIHAVRKLFYETYNGVPATHSVFGENYGEDMVCEFGAYTVLRIPFKDHLVRLFLCCNPFDVDEKMGLTVIDTIPFANQDEMGHAARGDMVYGVRCMRVMSIVAATPAPTPAMDLAQTIAMISPALKREESEDAAAGV